jgi:hypothetical protein
MNKRQLLYIKSLREMMNADDTKQMILVRSMVDLHCRFTTEERTEISSCIKNQFKSRLNNS